MDAVREVSGIISETISASERAAEAPPLAWPTSLFSLLFTLRYSTTAESLGLATRRFLVSGETLSEDISRLTGAAWRLCSRPLLYDAETGGVQIPLATEEEEEAVVAVKEKSVSYSPRHYSTQDVCRDAAARWALATADTATLRRRLLVPALRESRGIADHPLWAHTSEPLRPDLEELNERVEHALELGYSLTGALRRSVAYRFRDYTFARLFQPPAIDAERAEAIVRRDARPPPLQGGADTPPPLSMDDILYLGKRICKALVDVLDHHPAAPETTPIKTYTPAMDLNPEQITVTPRSPSVLAAFARTARVQTHHLVPALTDDSPSPVGQTPPPYPWDKRPRHSASSPPKNDNPPRHSASSPPKNSRPFSWVTAGTRASAGPAGTCHHRPTAGGVPFWTPPHSPFPPQTFPTRTREREGRQISGACREEEEEEKEHTRKRGKGHRISTPRPEPRRLRLPAPADAVRGLPPLLPGGQAAAAAQTEERRRHTRAPLISR